MEATVMIRLDEEMKSRWKASADAVGLSLSEWIRGRCEVGGLEEAEPTDLRPEDSTVHVDSRCRKLLGSCPPEEREDKVDVLVEDGIGESEGIPTGAALSGEAIVCDNASKDIKVALRLCARCARAARVGLPVRVGCEECRKENEDV